MRIARGFLALLCGSCLLSACASQSGTVYTRQQAQMAHSVEYGTVQRIEAVTLQGTRTGLGTIGGGGAGGVLGSTLGGGKGSALMAIGGAVAGAVGGTVAEEKLTTKPAIEIEVLLDSGEIRLVVQEAGDETFAVGDRVRVVQGADGSNRVRH